MNRMTFQQHSLLHNAQVELEALRAEGRGMVWENEWRVNTGKAVAYGDEAFNELAVKIRTAKVQVDELVTGVPRG